MDAYWRRLTNTTEPSVYGGDTNVNMSNYIDHLLTYTTSGARARSARA